MNIILAVMIGLLFGALLLGTGIFCWYLLKTIKKMETTVAQVALVFEPLIKTGTLKQAADAAAQLVAIGRAIVPAMGAINTTVAAFNKAFFKEGAVAQEEFVPAAVASSPGGDAKGFAKTGEAFSMSYTEEAAATHEKAEELRKMGMDPAAEETEFPGSTG